MSVRNQILILLACSLLVVKFGMDWATSANQAAASVRTATSKAKEAERLYRTVQTRIDLERPSIEGPPLLEARLSETVSLLHRQAKRNLIDLNQITPEGVATGSALRPINDLVQTNAAGLPFVRLQIKGQYKSLQGMERFTSAIAKGFVSISKIKLDRDTFELDLEIYGEI